jgi:hypothetical protein
MVRFWLHAGLDESLSACISSPAVALVVDSSHAHSQQPNCCVTTDNYRCVRCTLERSVARTAMLHNYYMRMNCSLSKVSESSFLLDSRELSFSDL